MRYSSGTATIPQGGNRKKTWNPKQCSKSYRFGLGNTRKNKKVKNNGKNDFCENVKVRFYIRTGRDFEGAEEKKREEKTAPEK